MINHFAIAVQLGSEVHLDRRTVLKNHFEPVRQSGSKMIQGELPKLTLVAQQISYS